MFFNELVFNFSLMLTKSQPHSIFRHLISDILQAITDLNSTWVILYSITYLKGIKILNIVQQTLVFNSVIENIFITIQKIMQIAIMILVQIIHCSTHNLPAAVLSRQAFYKSPYCMSICKFTLDLLRLMLNVVIHIQMKTGKSKYMTMTAY